MARKKHTTAILASRGHLLYRIDGEHGGKRYWSYAVIDQGKLESFKTALDSGIIHVQDFGKILTWGVGDAPPDNVKKELKYHYGFDVIA